MQVHIYVTASTEFAFNVRDKVIEQWQIDNTSL